MEFWKSVFVMELEPVQCSVKAVGRFFPGASRKSTLCTTTNNVLHCIFAHNNITITFSDLETDNCHLVKKGYPKPDEKMIES